MKAYLSWCDLTKEKCFNQWKRFRVDEKRQTLANLVKQHRLACKFNERKLLAKSFAGWDAVFSETKSILYQAYVKSSGRVQRLIFKTWRTLTVEGQRDRHSKEQRAMHYGRRLCLYIALQQWQFGIKASKNEREIERLVDKKRNEVYSWLGEL